MPTLEYVDINSDKSGQGLPVPSPRGSDSGLKEPKKRKITPNLDGPTKIKKQAKPLQRTTLLSYFKASTASPDLQSRNPSNITPGPECNPSPNFINGEKKSKRGLSTCTAEVSHSGVEKRNDETFLTNGDVAVGQSTMPSDEKNQENALQKLSESRRAELMGIVLGHFSKSTSSSPVKCLNVTNLANQFEHAQKGSTSNAAMVENSEEKDEVVSSPPQTPVAQSIQKCTSDACRPDQASPIQKDSPKTSNFLANGDTTTHQSNTHTSVKTTSEAESPLSDTPTITAQESSESLLDGIHSSSEGPQVSSTETMLDKAVPFEPVERLTVVQEKARSEVNTTLQEIHESRQSVTKSPVQDVFSEEATTLEGVSDSHADQSAEISAEPTPGKGGRQFVAAETLLRFEKMKENYTRQARTLLDRCRQGLEEESMSIQLPEEFPEGLGNLSDDQFPDWAIKHLATLVEGRAEPLSKLAQFAAKQLNRHFSMSTFSAISTGEKIKVLCQRKCYIKHPDAYLMQPSTCVDHFDDDNRDHFWRWEVTVLDLLPVSLVPRVKKARAVRKRISLHFSAVTRVILALNEFDALLKGNQPVTEDKIERIVQTVSLQEAKALKYGREEEKVRLEAEAKKIKEEEWARKKDEKKAKLLQKQQLSEERRKEREEKRDKSMQAKEAAKKAAKQLEEQSRKKCEEKKGRQVGLMMSFLSRPDAKSDADRHEVLANTPIQKSEDGGHDLRSQINGYGTSAQEILFASLSSGAKQSRLRRTKEVSVSVPVLTTTSTEDSFDSPQYVEMRDVTIRNKYKFLLFHEDVRPAYYGTWSKFSSVVTGKNPFAKDLNALDYEFDSEAEWEEGDDDLGEDLDQNHQADEEEGKDEEDDSCADDGWLARDDELEDDLDEETKLLRRKQHQSQVDYTQELKICMIAPRPSEFSGNLVASQDELAHSVEGFELSTADALLKSLSCVTFSEEVDLFLDFFPPQLVEEDPASVGASPDKRTIKSSEDEVSDENLRAIANFIHHNTIASKEKLVDELRRVIPTLATSRAQAARLIDSMAMKSKHRTSGAPIWEVKPEVFDRLGINKDEIGSQEADMENMRVVARFIHGCTLTSKDKLVDELRRLFPAAVATRAEAARIVDSIAEKKKDPVKGMHWLVKRSVMGEWGLGPSTTESSVSEGGAFSVASPGCDDSCSRGDPVECRDPTDLEEGAA